MVLPGADVWLGALEKKINTKQEPPKRPELVEKPGAHGHSLRKLNRKSYWLCPITKRTATDWYPID